MKRINFSGNTALFKIVCVLLFFLSFSSATAGADISADAKRNMARGMAAMEYAKTESDYRDAIIEFKKALEFAPEWSDAWFNLGVAQEAAGDYEAGISSFRSYLRVNPIAEDKEAVQTRIYGLEYRSEKEKQRDTERKIAEAKGPDYGLLAGKWCQNNYCLTMSTQGNQFEMRTETHRNLFGGHQVSIQIYRGRFDSGGRVTGSYLTGNSDTRHCGGRPIYDTTPLQGKLTMEENLLFFSYPTYSTNQVNCKKIRTDSGYTVEVYYRKSR